MNTKLTPSLLKWALFATGLSGIVAEYILSTLASYFLGDSVFQWTITVSIMLFSMGLGSRLSQWFKTNLLAWFIAVEFALSLLVSFTSLMVYSVAIYSQWTAIFIYGLSILLGLFIGLEIPLVIRLNKTFESLRVNIASVMEKDYLGSLVGGLFFAFIGLPYLGLTYTPFVLGALNFMTAFLLWFEVRKEFSQFRKTILGGIILVPIFILIGIYFAEPIVQFSEQANYKDKVIYSHRSKYQQITLTQWKNDYWLYLNGNQQFSTVDEERYHEPLVHPLMHQLREKKDILVLGGGDGLALREILKYPSIGRILLVDIDPAMTDFGMHHLVMKTLNQEALSSKKVSILHQDGFQFMNQTTTFFDAIILDLPDPKTIELSRLYSKEFYRLCYQHLRKNGWIVTQAGSPTYATKAFLSIEKTMQKVGFRTAKMHNQVITLGEWGWVIGTKNPSINVKKTLQHTKINQVSTKWLNDEAMGMMTSFGKEINLEVEINTLQNPRLYHYYKEGNWNLY